MPEALSIDAVEQYRRNGFYSPVDVLDRREVRRYRDLLEDYERRTGGPIGSPARSKPHLLFPWADELIRLPAVLDVVEDLIGPDILCWNSLWWIKEAHSTSFVSWHQDARYWGLDTGDLVTVWLALSPATVESGCMRVLPGSHIGDPLPHEDRYKDANMLTRGQEITVDIDESQTVAMALEPGQISVHNIRLAHASGENTTSERRIGLSMHYIPPSARQLAVDWDTAALVRGEDRYGHFALAPRPRYEFDEQAVKFHEQASAVFRDIVFKDAERVRPLV